MIIYLDFDGVLHGADELALDENCRFISNPKLFEYVPILEEILHPAPNAKIVVSSDWARLLDDANLVRILGQNLGNRFIGVVEQRGSSRSEEILADANKRCAAKWLALDDHPSVRSSAKKDKRFIYCPPALGISDKSVQQTLRASLLKMQIQQTFEVTPSLL